MLGLECARTLTLSYTLNTMSHKHAHTVAFKCMHTPVHFLSPAYTFTSTHKCATDTHQREGSHVVDFEGVLRPVLLAVVNLQCGSRRVIAL